MSTKNKLFCGLVASAYFFASTSVDAETQAEATFEGIRHVIDHLPDSAESEKAAISYIRSLRNDMLPYVISSLQDYRDIPTQSLNMIPGPGADKNMPARQVSASNVSSLLMRLLEEKTGESFGLYFYDFEVQTPNDLSINKWRNWCELKYPSMAKECWNEKNGVREIALPRQLKK